MTGARSVTVVDDTLRQNAAVVHMEEHGPVRVPVMKLVKEVPRSETYPDGVAYVRPGDKVFGARQVQHVVEVERTLEGAHLEHAIRRARRWMRRPRRGGTPSHIALFMLAFHKADPAGFDEARRGMRR